MMPLSIPIDTPVVLDVETASLSPTSGLCEIALYHDTLDVSWLTRPSSSPSRAATALHGLTSEALRHATPLRSLLPSLGAFLHCRIVLGYHLLFDLTHLAHAFLTCSLTPPTVHAIDLAPRLARHLGLSSPPTLAGALSLLGLAHLPFSSPLHRASGDAQRSWSIAKALNLSHDVARADALRIDLGRLI